MYNNLLNDNEYSYLDRIAYTQNTLNKIEYWTGPRGEHRWFVLWGFNNVLITNAMMRIGNCQAKK